MTEVGYAALGIIPSFDGFQAKLEQGSGKALIAAGTSGGAKFGESAGKAAKGKFASMAKGIVAPLLGAFAAVKVKDFLGDSIAEARESQKVGALTTQVIKSTGKAAHVSAKQVGDLATQISNKAGVDDEAIQSGVNMLLTFKNIRNEAGKGNKIFTQAAKATTDVAAAMAAASGGQLNFRSASIQVGKALNDPIKGVTALARVGVQFDEQQKEQIKTLVANGRTMDAQKIILRELNSEFGGAAAAQATWGEKASVAWSNFKEGVGTALLPVIDTIEKKFVREGIPELNKFSAWFAKDGVRDIEEFGTKAKGVLTDTRDVLKDIEPYAKGVAKAFDSLPDGVKKGLGAAAVLGFGAKKLGVGSLLGSKGGLGGGSGLLGMVSKAKPIPVFVVNGGVGGGSLPGVAGKVGTAAKAEKFGKWGGLLGLPGLVAAGTGLALEKGHPLSGMPPITGMAAKAITGFIDKRKIDDTTTSVLRQNDAWSKVRDNMENGTTKAHILSAEIMGTRREVEKLTGPRHVVKMEAPNLLNLLDNVRRYGSLLDGLDGRVVRTFLTTTRVHQSGTGGTTDSGESIGKHSPTVQRSSTSGGNVFDFSGSTIVPHDYSDFMYQTQQRARRASLDGIRR